MSEALIFASVNPQYDTRLFTELHVQYMKIPRSNLGKTCCVQKLFLTFRTIFVHNMFSPCSAKRRASDKDLPVQERQIVEDNFNMDYQDYVQGHETRYLSQVSFIIMTKNFSQDSLSQHLGLLDQGKEIDGALRKIVVKTRSKENVTFDDVCAKSRRSGGQKCQENGILELSSLKYLNTYPTYKHPITKEVIVVPAFLGNISLNDENTALVEDASVLRLFYILDESKKNVKAWEKMALQFIEKNNELLDDRYEIFAINSKSLERELTENMHNALGILPVSVGILVCFITMNGLVLTEWKPLFVIR